MKRSNKGPKAAATASKRARSETPLTLPPANQLVADFVAIEATTHSSPLIPKGLKKKAKAVKPTKDAFDLFLSDTLPSGPNSPLPKSSLGF